MIQKLSSFIIYNLDKILEKNDPKKMNKISKRNLNNYNTNNNEI